MGNAKRDDNYVPTLIAVSNADGSTPVTLYADPTTHRLLVSASAGNFDDLVDVAITNGTQGDIIYYSGTQWVNLGPGTSGKYLKTGGPGASPSWDTPTSVAAGSDTQVQFNDGGTNLAGNTAFTFNKTTGTLKVTGIDLGNTGLVIGASTPFSDSSGTLTLQNIDALDATTEATIEAAIDSLGTLAMTGGLTNTVDDGDNYVAIALTNNDTTNNPKVLTVVNAGTANAVHITQSGNIGASSSVGGALLITNTQNSGAGLLVYSNQASSADNLVGIRVDHSSFAHSGLRIDYDGAGDALTISATAASSNAASLSNTGVDHTVNISYTGTTANKGALNLTSSNVDGSPLQVTGSCSALGVAKITHTGIGTADASLLSLAGSNAAYAGQGIFLDMETIAATQKLINIRADNVEKFVVDSTGITVGTWNSTIIAMAKGGTGAALSDPNADRLMFWDDSQSSVDWLTLGTGLQISGTTASVAMASVAQVNNGTETSTVINPDVFAGSNFGKRIIELKIDSDTTAMTTGTNKFIFCIPSDLNGMNLVDADCFVTTNTGSAAQVGIYNVTDGTDMLTTNMFIDPNENTSYTAATQSVINTGGDDVATGDLLRVDVNTVMTGGKGLGIILVFQLP